MLDSVTKFELNFGRAPFAESILSLAVAVTEFRRFMGEKWNVYIKSHRGYSNELSISR